MQVWDKPVDVDVDVDMSEVVVVVVVIEMIGAMAISTSYEVASKC